MIKTLTIVSLIVITSCGKHQSNPNDISDSTERTTSIQPNEPEDKDVTTEKTKKSDKSPITSGQLINTTWTNQIMDGVYDSLIFTSSEEVEYYSAESGLSYDSRYRIDNDTLKIDIYDLKSQVDPNAGLEIVSKYHLVLSGSNLKFAKILHKARDKFIEVDKQIYNSVGDFTLAK